MPVCGQLIEIYWYIMWISPGRLLTWVINRDCVGMFFLAKSSNTWSDKKSYQDAESFCMLLGYQRQPKKLWKNHVYFYIMASDGLVLLGINLNICRYSEDQIWALNINEGPLIADLILEKTGNLETPDQPFGIICGRQTSIQNYW